VQSLDDLRGLGKPGALTALLEASAERARGEAEHGVVAAAADDPMVATLSAIRAFVSAAVELNALFDQERATVRPDVSLAQVKAAIDKAETTAEQMGASDVAKEIGAFSAWLTPFLALEGPAKLQAKTRVANAQAAQAGFRPHWSKYAERLPGAELGLAAGDLGSAINAFRALKPKADALEAEGRQDALVERHMKQLAMLATVEGALNQLSSAPSPKAEANLRAAQPQFEALMGQDGARWLQDTLKDLEQLHRLDEVQMGRGARGGPLSVVAVRAALGREGRR